MLLRCLWPGASGLLLACLLPVPFGGSPADSLQPEQLSHERTVLVESFAREKLWHWQKSLNLEGWEISLVVVRSTELRPNTLGNIRWDRENKTATIRVLDPAEHPMPFREMLDDTEFTVVHELIHLKRDLVLNHYSRSETNRSKEERAVNHVAETLLKLDRGR